MSGHYVRTAAASATAGGLVGVGAVLAIVGFVRTACLLIAIGNVFALWVAWTTSDKACCRRFERDRIKTIRARIAACPLCDSAGRMPRGAHCNHPDSKEMP